MLHILTLNWNGESHLKSLYLSLVHALEGIDYKWMIKDNGSKDNSIEYIKSLNNDNITIFDYKHNRNNFSQGCNFLFREAAPKPNDYILLLNNDIIIKNKDSIKNMIELFESDDNIGVVGAKLLYSDGDMLQHAGVVFSERTNNLPTNYRRGARQDSDSDKNREFQAITGAVMLTKAKYYENICRTNKSGLHGLDELYQWCFEDISACLSIKYDMNKKILYCGNTSFIHEESATLKKNPVNKLFMNHNVKHFLNKWQGKYTNDLDRYMTNSNYGLL